MPPRPWVSLHDRLVDLDTSLTTGHECSRLWQESQRTGHARMSRQERPGVWCEASLHEVLTRILAAVRYEPPAVRGAADV
jgi:hypothetical protein